MSDLLSPAPAAAASSERRTAASLDIVIANPYVWPYVRRGSERLIHHLGGYLRDRGHRVRVLATAPEARVEQREGVEYCLFRFVGPTAPRQLNGLHAFALQVARDLGARPCDAALSLSYFDAFGMLRARARSGRPLRVVHYNAGIPVRRYFRAVPLDAWWMRCVVNRADALAVASEFAAAKMLSEFRRLPVVLPPPVDLAPFATPMTSPPPDVPAGRPLILFSGAADEPRKGAALLCRAFAAVKAARPGAVLVFSGHASPATRSALLALVPDTLREAVLFPGVGDVSALPSLYGAADVTVLPARWEAFGMVLVESLAAGTPVVGLRHAGIPEIVEGLQASRLVAAPDGDAADDPASLAQAILDVLAAGKTDGVRRECRDRAARYALERVGPLYEQLLAGAGDA